MVNAEHSIKIQYIQGPRYAIALQLFASLNKETAQGFPGRYFQLTASNERWWHSSIINAGIIVLLIVVLLVIAYTSRKRRKPAFRNAS